MLSLHDISIMPLTHYFLGCPVWSNRDWVDRLFHSHSKPTDYLMQYSAVFNTVEGNTTFYGLPQPDTVKRWCEDAAAGFQFCFKFPRTISHELQLQNAQQETVAFLQRLTPLRDKNLLGPLFLQLPPMFSPCELDLLAAYLHTLPTDWDYAVEVRHTDFFITAQSADALNSLLTSKTIQRVILDSRALFTAAPIDPDTQAAQRKKPRLPVFPIAIGQKPLIRFIGHPELAANSPFLTVWVDTLSQWITEGRTPYFFAHTPNNILAPELARLFHQQLQAALQPVLNLGHLLEWPIPSVKSVTAVSQQFDLF